MFPAGVALEDIGEADVGGSAETFDEGIAEHNGAGGGGMHRTLNIAGSVTVGVVFDRVASALVNEMTIGAVPHSEGGVDVGPEGVVIEVIAGTAGGPFFGMNQDERGEFGQDREDEEIDQYEFENVPELLKKRFWLRSFCYIRRWSGHSHSHRGFATSVTNNILKRNER